MTIPTAESIVRSLRGKKNRKGWKARCPAHDDKNPSLSIAVGDSGKILLKCHTGCTQEAVIDALRRRGLWENGAETRRRANGHATEASLPPHPQFGAPDHRFDYFDAHGRLVGTVCRWERTKDRPKKEIRPATLSGTRWTWKAFPEPRPLYRLPDLLTQQKRPVLIVEGEKTAEVARELVGDMTVTTWPGGADAVAQADWSPLVGRDVVLWADNDDPGRKAMREIGGLLTATKSVRVVKLPDGLPEAWDLADEISTDIDPVALIRSAVSEHTGPCLALADWLARDIPSPDFLLGELFSTTNRALLSAPTGLGKTNFSMALGIAVAAGQNFLHWKSVRPARVLLIDGEMSRRLLKRRLADAARRLGSVPTTFFALCREDVENMPPLNTPDGQAFVDGIIIKIGGIDFLIPDSVMSLTSGDQKDEEPWSNTMPWVRSLTRRSIGQCWIHHTGLDQSRSYGTSTREWQLDTVMLMEAAERPRADIAFSLKFTKARERTPHNRSDFDPVVITLSQDQWAVETSASEATAKSPKKPSPNATAFHQALLGALIACGKPRHEAGDQPSVSMEEWKAECVQRRIIDPDKKANVQSATFSKYRLELIASRWIACNGNVVWNRAVAQ